ncbi:MAG TPA: HD domain-containing phosphohydrolase [Vicinamibacterales bacterium]|jgi:putative nucleotidyltransferase with HDIG domain
MSDPIGFLHAFAHMLGIATLYPEGHPSRERAIDAAYEALADLPVPSAITFLEDEVVFGRERLRGLRSWDWGTRLVNARIQRIEIERRVSRDEFEGFLQEVLLRLSQGAVDTSEARQMRSLGIRFGKVDVDAAPDTSTWAEAAATLDVMLGEEAETFRWLLNEVQSNSSVPLLEAEAVVRSLSVAMCTDSPMVLPLLKLKEFDQYTTTHSLNVSVLSMALAETLGFRSPDVRAIGVAGLLHDIGKVRIPIEILTKPGKLTDDERAIMNRHPVDGAQYLMQSHDDLSLAATVAYEHHIMLNGGGYPKLHYQRDCATASKLVHVCDVFDALGTTRPYRDAWPMQEVFDYLEGRAGTEFDPDLVSAFIRTMKQGRAQIRVLTDDRSESSPLRSDQARP